MSACLITELVSPEKETLQSRRHDCPHWTVIDIGTSLQTNLRRTGLHRYKDLFSRPRHLLPSGFFFARWLGSHKRIQVIKRKNRKELLLFLGHLLPKHPFLYLPPISAYYPLCLLSLSYFLFSFVSKLCLHSNTDQILAAEGPPRQPASLPPPIHSYKEALRYDPAFNSLHKSQFRP